MVDFDRISEALDAPEQELAEVSVQFVTLAGVQTVEVVEGTTVGEVKEDNELEGKKFVTDDGVILSDSDIITQDMTIYISTSKENGVTSAPVKKN